MTPLACRMLLFPHPTMISREFSAFHNQVQKEPEGRLNRQTITTGESSKNPQLAGAETTSVC